MKYLACIFLISFFTFSYAQETDQYRVTAIDSTAKHYLVSVEKENLKGVIITKKLKRKERRKYKQGKNRIEIDETLTLAIKRYWLFPSNYNDFNEYSIDNKIVWRKGDDFFLYQTADLKGLYYIPLNE